jgi:ribosomal-protein-serine acetyltransferase
MTWPPHVNDLRDVQQFIVKMGEGFGAGTCAGYALIGDDHVLGVVSLNAIVRAERSAEIGYWICQDSQGKGLVTTAVRALIGAFSQADLVRRFIIKASVKNERSNKIAERLGFSRECVLPKGEVIGDEAHDQNVWSFDYAARTTR